MILLVYPEVIPWVMQASIDLGYAQSGEYAFISFDAASTSDAVQVSVSSFCTIASYSGIVLNYIAIATSCLKVIHSKR
jgi:hypothetical protein